MRGMQLFSPTFTILLLFFIVDDLSFYTLLVSIIAISFTIPIITLSFVLASLYCYKNRAESIGSFSSDSSSFSSARTRLAWTLFTFTLLSLGEAIPASFMVSITINGDITLCENFYIADHLIFAAFMTSFQTLAWSIALIVDPVCGLIFDPKVRKVVGRHISYFKRKVSQMFERCCFCSDSVKSIEESEKEEDTIEESLRDHSVQFPTSSE
ncbi:hypothetical protein CAEBREN_17830 [Caenorhabditis brenneri]|uniref:Uncharacterized protein n=1 Tax=Caenorhabditis brenneri TaxID=135651 RepID=G0MPE6_CAEBE|nr:hypothetical protein CAEBREN_17830 [Caenorhabditis brenneri]